MKKLTYLGALLALPAIASAQTLGTIFGTVKSLLDSLIPIIITLAVIYFFYGVAKYVMAAGDEEAQKAGRSIMIYGIVGLFVIVAVWGLVAVLGNTLGVTVGGGAPTLPTV
jgi:uncharacterized membrane protein